MSSVFYIIYCVFNYVSQEFAGVLAKDTGHITKEGLVLIFGHVKLVW